MASYPAPLLFLAALVFLPSGASGGTVPACTSGDCHSEANPAVSAHDPFRDGTCVACHAPVAAFDRSGHDGSSFASWDSPAAPCGGCHEETAALVAETSHGVAGTNLCLSCHLPHQSSYPRLLRSDYPGSSYLPFDTKRYGICWECHDSALATEKFTGQTGFRQGRRNFHYSHLHKRKGMTCRICHDPHDGRQPYLLRSTLSQSDAGWRGGMVFTPSPEGGTCQGGCHKNLSYRR